MTAMDTRGVGTANTEAQLRTKTWPELAKWHALALNREWFTYTAIALHAALPAKDRSLRSMTACSSSSLVPIPPLVDAGHSHCETPDAGAASACDDLFASCPRRPATSI